MARVAPHEIERLRAMQTPPSNLSELLDADYQGLPANKLHPVGYSRPLMVEPGDYRNRNRSARVLVIGHVELDDGTFIERKKVIGGNV